MPTRHGNTLSKPNDEIGKLLNFCLEAIGSHWTVFELEPNTKEHRIPHFSTRTPYSPYWETITLTPMPVNGQFLNVGIYHTTHTILISTVDEGYQERMDEGVADFFKNLRERIGE